MVVGFVGGLRFAAYSYFFEEYPINSYEDCSYIARPMVVPGEKSAEGSEEIYKQELERCQQNLVGRRKIAQVNDAVWAVGLLLSGVVLFWLFNPKGVLTSSYK